MPAELSPPPSASSAASGASAAIHASHLTRQFGARTAVSDLSFSVAGGEIVALLGPNGAGKTTTLRMLAGLIKPSSGEVEVRGPVGLLTEMPGLWERLSVTLNLSTYARLYGLDDRDRDVERVLDLVGLSHRAGDPAGQLSKGLKQRLALARALIHDPTVVLLDEPTAGLDPASARHVRDIIAGLRREGRAVLVSTHNLAEAEDLSDRIAVLNTRLLALDRASVLRQQLSGTRVEILVDGDAGPWAAIARSHAKEVEASGGRLLVTVASPTEIPNLVTALVAGGARLMHVASGHRSLEEVYLELVGET